MYVAPVQLLWVLLFALGVYWCYVVLRRFPDDLQELREAPDNTRRGVIVFIWFLTVIIAIAVVLLSLPVVTRIIKAIYGVFTIG